MTSPVVLTTLPTIDPASVWRDEHVVRVEQTNHHFYSREEAAMQAAGALAALEVFDRPAGAGEALPPGEGVPDEDDMFPDPADLDDVVRTLHEELDRPSRNLTWADIVRVIDHHRAINDQRPRRAREDAPDAGSDVK